MASLFQLTLHADYTNSRALSESAVRAIVRRFGSSRARDSANFRAWSAVIFAGGGGSIGSTTACSKGHCKVLALS